MPLTQTVAVHVTSPNRWQATRPQPTAGQEWNAIFTISFVNKLILLFHLRNILNFTISLKKCAITCHFKGGKLIWTQRTANDTTETCTTAPLYLIACSTYLLGPSDQSGLKNQFPAVLLPCRLQLAQQCTVLQCSLMCAERNPSKLVSIIHVNINII